MHIQIMSQDNGYSYVRNIPIKFFACRLHVYFFRFLMKDLLCKILKAKLIILNAIRTFNIYFNCKIENFSNMSSQSYVFHKKIVEKVNMYKMSLFIFCEWLFLISKTKLPLNQPKNNTQKEFGTGKFNILSPTKEALVRKRSGSQII